MYESFYDDLSSDEEIVEFRKQNDHLKRMRELARQDIANEALNPETEDSSEKVRNMLRTVSERIAEECEEARQRTRAKDQETMQNIEKLLKCPHQPPRYTFRRDTIGVPIYDQHQHHPHHHHRGSLTNPYLNRAHFETEPATLNGTISRSESESRFRVKDPYSTEPSTHETTRQRMRRVEAHLDGILDYEAPSADNFKHMRNSLRDIQDKMNVQKLLLDRRAKPDAYDDSRDVGERIDEKYRELEERMPCLSAAKRKTTYERNERFDPVLVPGYSTGLGISNSTQTAELRGRIRSLLCRTRDKSGKSHAPSRHHIGAAN